MSLQESHCNTSLQFLLSTETAPSGEPSLFIRQITFIKCFRICKYQLLQM